MNEIKVCKRDRDKYMCFYEAFRSTHINIVRIKELKFFLTLRELQFKSVNKKHRQATIFNKIAIFQIENLLFIVPHMSLDCNHFTIFFLSLLFLLFELTIHLLSNGDFLTIYLLLFVHISLCANKNKDETGFNFFLCHFLRPLYRCT